MREALAQTEKNSGAIPRGNLQDQLDNFTSIVGYIFSWAVLLPAAVILSGHFLASVFPMRGVTGIIFKISLWFLRLEARNDEVILGLAGFLITFGIVAFSGGEAFYRYAAIQFGINPGQFHTLCFASAIITVAWSVTLWLCTTVRPSRAEEQKKIKALMKEIKAKANAESLSSDPTVPSNGGEEMSEERNQPAQNRGPGRSRK